MIRVLYLHPAGAFGGASKSLIELYMAAKKLGDIEAVILTPRGTVTTAFGKAGMQVVETMGLSQFDHTRYGYYRHLRWLILLRELFYLPITLIALLKLRRLKADFDIIHVNEITLLPTALLTKWLFKLPMVFHIRSVQYPDQASWRSRCVFKLLDKMACAVICIDETVRASVPSYIQTTVIHNSIYLDQKVMRKNLSEDNIPSFGMAGVLLRAKGVFEFLEAARIVVKERKVNVRFIIAGENARQTAGVKRWLFKKLGFNEDVLNESKEFVRLNKLEEHVFFKGFIEDIRSFYSEIDVICFPSHLNACGRPVFEGALLGIPSIVAIKNPLNDALINQVTGLAIEHPEPSLLADAIEKLATNSKLRELLGQQAENWASEFYNLEKNAHYLYQVYFGLLARSDEL